MSISIKIGNIVGTKYPDIEVSGSSTEVITDNQRHAFGIGSDNTVKQGVANYFSKGREPNDVYLHSPTPWGDLYKSYNWQQVQTIMNVKSSNVTDLSSVPVIVTEKIFRNDSQFTGTFKGDISHEVSSTLESNWSNSSSLSASVGLSYEVFEASLSYEKTFGKGGSQSKTETLKSGDEVSVTLKPGQAVKAELQANKKTIKIRTIYEASLRGVVATNYNPTYDGHHFYKVDVNGVVRGAGRNTTVEIIEDVSIQFFSESRVILQNIR